MIEQLVKGVLSADKRKIARALTIIEDELDGSQLLLRELYKHTGKAYKVGITGPPGAGKSSITNSLIKNLIKENFKIGVIAVDPTSPFTGGALLGDRVRMQETGMSENVFIRSMATRGSLGGLSKMVSEACDVLDASGKDFILIETVGVGQSELDIVNAADTTVVVLVPESGDSIQAMKAGLMEIADIFVVNKSDREGADGLAATIKNIIHLKPPSEDNWVINVLKTIAIKENGIEELKNEIFKHRDNLFKTGYLSNKRKRNIVNQIHELVNDKLQHKFWKKDKTNLLDESLEDIFNRKKDPYSFVESLISGEEKHL